MAANDVQSSGPVGHIVVGVDESDGSLAALRWASTVAADRSADGSDTRCTAVTAWNRPAFDVAGFSDPDTLEEAAAEMLSRTVAGLPGPDADRVETIARLGAPVDVLIEEGAKLDADLIVVGTRGRGPLANLLLGGVSRALAARADRPVAIVPAAEVSTGGPTVVGYDGSPGGRGALAWAIVNGDGPITAVWAWHLPPEAIYSPETIDAERLEADLLDQLERDIADLAAQHPDRDVPSRVTPVVQKDDARLALIREGKQAAAIVLGARSAAGVKGLLLGSTVDYVASHADQVVIVVPPPGEATDDG